MVGQVIKLHSNDYYVESDNTVYKCTARGIMKLKKDGILVGDYVDFKNSVIEKVRERTSFFIRPSVANVEQVVIVISSLPEPDFLMIDKLLASGIREDVNVLFAINKADINSDIYKQITTEYKDTGIEILIVSAKEKTGLDELKERLDGKLTVLAGQSAVGKSSLVNALLGLQLKTGELSEKVARGKHTTTFSQIYKSGDIRLIDTPGFAVLEADIEPENLANCYPEYEKLINSCKFRCCSHTNEPDCKVKNLVEKGELSRERYERYLIIYNELKQRRKSYE